MSWLPSLDGWLVTRHDLVLAAMRDAQTFTVDDPRFSTAQVVGPSMLSLDGAEHDRHRAPFVGPFRAGDGGGAVRAVRLTMGPSRLIDALAPAGAGELRRAFAGTDGGRDRHPGARAWDATRWPTCSAGMTRSSPR